MHPHLRTASRWALLLGLPGALIAQGTTSGVLNGTIRGADGKGLAGATVRLVSPALMGERVAHTLENGAFRFPVLPPGRYRVQVSAPGFQTQEAVETIEMARTATLNFRLAPRAGAEVIVTAAAADAPSMATVASSVNYTGEMLQELPLQRDLTAIMSQTPGVVSGVAWGGDRTNANAYLMDGINIGDPLFGTQYIYANPDWFEEVQVGGLGAPAEYGGFSGGYINSLIKRGGNTFSGTLAGYYTPPSFTAEPRLSDVRLRDNYTPPAPAKAWDAALNLGGPILKDQLWFFASIQKKADSQTPVGAPAAVSTSNPTFLGKLSWQVANPATVELFFSYDGVYRERRGISNLTEAEATRRQAGTNRTWGMNWIQVLSERSVFTLKGTGFNGSYGLYPYQEVPAVSLDVPFQSRTLFRSATRGEAYDSSRLGVQAIFDHARAGLIVPGDTHAFRFGLEWEQGQAVEDTWLAGGLTYYGTTQTPASGPAFAQTSYVVKGGDLHLRATLERRIAYAQDVWTVNDRFTLFPGLRLEAFTGRPFGWGGKANLWDTRTLAPRLGMSLALTRDLRTVLKVHLGRYFDGLTAVHFDRALPGGYGVSQRYYWGTGSGFSPAAFDVRNPEAVPYSPTPYRTSEDTNNSRMDPGLKHPYTDEALVTLERKFGSHWTLGLTGTYRVNRRMLIREDRLLGGGWTGQVYDPVTGGTLPVFDQNNPKVGGVMQHDYVITNADESDPARRAKRDYKAASFTWDRRQAGNWFTSGSLTFALRRGNLNRSNGYDDAFANPNYLVNAEGRLPYYNDLEFKWRGGYTFPWKMRVSGSFTYLSGERYTRTLATPTQVLSGVQTTLFAEPRGASRYPSRHLLDLQVSQTLALGAGIKAEVFLDMFNVLNTGTPLAWTTRSNDYRYANATDDPTATWINRDYLKPTSQENPRQGRLGLRLKF